MDTYLDSSLIRTDRKEDYSGPLFAWTRFQNRFGKFCFVFIFLIITPVSSRCIHIRTYSIKGSVALNVL